MGAVELHDTEVDGIPVVWSEVPGPLRAGLLFRVGQADERLVERGVTHLADEGDGGSEDRLPRALVPPVRIGLSR
jgi:hypothetical protein